MTDLPLPEPDLRTDTDVYPHGRHAYSGAQCVRYAAAKTAELQAKVTRYEESTRLAEAHITLTLAQLAEAQAECASEKANNDAMVDCCDALDKKCRQLEAECARLRGSIEAAARYGWEHDRWQWSAVKGGLDRFTDAALRGKETP